MPLTASAVEPVLFMVSAAVTVEPTVTLPNARLPLKPITGPSGGVGVVGVLSLSQAEIDNNAARTIDAWMYRMS
jgi:hypothetical protein